MTSDGFGGVSGRSGMGRHYSSASQLRFLQLTGRGIENHIGRTVDHPSLEAGVGVAEGYRGCHRGSHRGRIVGQRRVDSS
jgi:hypothetical protein